MNSPDSSWFLYCGSGAAGIHRLLLEKGEQSVLRTVVAEPTHCSFFMAAHPTRPLLYSVDISESSVTSFSVTEDGSLVCLNRVASGGTAPCHLVVDSQGRYLLVANYGGGVGLFPIQSNGQLEEMASFVRFHGAGPHPSRQTESHPHGVALDPKSRLAYVADLGTDQIFALRIAEDPFCLTLEPSLTLSVAAGAGPRHIIFKSDGNSAIVINELANSLTLFRATAETGFSKMNTVSTLRDPSGRDRFAAELLFHPREHLCYASNRGENTLGTFALDEDKGTLSPLGWIDSGGNSPQHFIIAPAGDALFVANSQSNSITAFELDPGNGHLGRWMADAHVPKPNCLALVQQTPGSLQN